MKKGRPRPLTEVERVALFLDIDGTLLGIAPTPDAVHVPPKLVEVLERLVLGLGGAVALLTGRRIADADRLLSPLKLVARRSLYVNLLDEMIVVAEPAAQQPQGGGGVGGATAKTGGDR